MAGDEKKQCDQLPARMEHFCGRYCSGLNVCFGTCDQICLRAEQALLEAWTHDLDQAWHFSMHSRNGQYAFLGWTMPRELTILHSNSI